MRLSGSTPEHEGATAGTERGRCRVAAALPGRQCVCGLGRSLVLLLLCGLGAAAGGQDAATPPGRVEQLNQAFLRHVRSLGDEHALAVRTIVAAWEDQYRTALPGSFVPDALAVLYPAYGAALRALDEDRLEDVVRLLAPLREHQDAFLAANATYFHARALVALGRFEQALLALATLETQPQMYVAHTPYAPHLWLLRGFCEARDLRFEQALRTLQAAERRFPDAPEAVRVGIRQLLLEIQRREQGTLGEVATVMDHVADRLHVGDAGAPVRERQQQVVAMLDRLIEQQQQQEQQRGAGGRQARAGQPPPQQSPQAPRQESSAPEGAGSVGELHAVPPADPGASWGRLPPAERDRILQSIRERFPSRYRQLVEQYYRALADEKK